MSFGYAKLDHPDVLRVLFHPRPEERPPSPGTECLTIPVAEGVRLGARFFPAADRSGAPTLLFFHGNGELAEDYEEVGRQFAGEGLHFLVVDYRGYGQSDGVPTVTAMLTDAQAVLVETEKWLKERGCAGPLLVMGRSLGSASAIELMATQPEKLSGLIIDSGFAYTMPLLATLGVDVQGLGLQEADGFKNQMKMALVRKPTYILHAQHDQLIPVASAEVLQAQCNARNKEFVIVPGADHNTILAYTGRLYFQVIRKFITKALQPVETRRRSYFRNG